MDAEHVGMCARWFNLTLVKGDEGVEAEHDRRDGRLLFGSRKGEVYITDFLIVDMYDRLALRPLCQVGVRLAVCDAEREEIRLELFGRCDDVQVASQHNAR